MATMKSFTDLQAVPITAAQSAADDGVMWHDESADVEKFMSRLELQKAVGHGPPRTNVDAAAGAATVDFANGANQSLVLTSGATTLTLSNPRDGVPCRLLVVQPGSGAAGTITWPGSVAWPGASAPTLTATNGRIDVIELTYYAAASKYLARVVAQDFTP